MSLKENAQTIAENMPKVYEAGKTSQWHTLWDSLQDKGARVAYGYFFHKWDESAFYPKYDIVIGGSATAGESRSVGAFRQFNPNGKEIDLASRLEECGVRLDTSECRDATYLFMNAKISRLPTIDMSNASAANMNYTFASVYLETIDKLIVSASSYFHVSTFQHATNLTNLTIQGTISRNNFNVSYCTLLTHDSLLSILNALKDYSTDTSGTTWVVTLGTENLNKLTDEEKAIATQKGWTIA